MAVGKTSMTVESRCNGKFFVEVSPDAERRGRDGNPFDTKENRFDEALSLR